MTIEQEIRLLEEDQKELAVTLGSLGLSIVGLLTGFGEAADAANAALFYSTGHPVLGTISGLSALPIPIVEQALGLTVGSCLLVKVIWIGAKILKSAVVIVTKTKILKPAIAFVRKTGHFFQFALDKGKICFKQLAYTLTHSNMKPGYVNLGAEVTVSGSKALFTKLLDAIKKMADIICRNWQRLKSKPIKETSINHTAHTGHLDIGGRKNIDKEMYYNYIYKGDQNVIKHQQKLSPGNNVNIFRPNPLTDI